MLSYKYFKSLENGIICSLDNLVMYFFTTDSVDNIIDYVHDNFDIDQKGYYENLDKAPSSKYSYWKSHLHCCNLYVRLGKFIYLKNDKKYDTVDMVSFEINPNKHSDSKEYALMLDIINKFCDGGGYLKQFDFAIDVPCAYDDLIVFPDNRKIDGLYKGTRYFGSGHNKHGFTKTYDKTKESNLDYDLSRVEVTFTPSESYKIIDFGVRNITFTQQLKGQMRSLAIAVKTLESMGIPTNDILDPLGYRQRIKIKEWCSGGVEHIKIPDNIIPDLLDKLREDFDINTDPFKKIVPDFKPRTRAEDFKLWFDNLDPDNMELPF